MDSIKVVIIDDEMPAITRMKVLLKNFPEVEIAGLFQDPQAALLSVLDDAPDLIFLDIEMPGMTGIEFASEVNRNHIDSKIVFISSHDQYALNAIREEAFDYLLKPVSIDELKRCLIRFQSKVQSKLSKRELEIIKLMSEGNNSQKVAEKLFISRHTVDTYRRDILAKTGCKNSAELITYAVRGGLV